MTGRNGYFNSISENMKEAAQRYVGIESEGLISRIGTRIETLSSSNKWDQRVEIGLKESVENMLRTRTAKFIGAFNSLFYSEYGESPTKELKVAAAEYLLRYTELLRGQESRIEKVQSGFNIRGSLMQFGVETDALTEQMAKALKPMSRK